MVLFRRLALAAFLAIGLPAVLGAAYAQTPIPSEPDTERRTRYTATAQTGPFSVGFDLYGDSTDYQNWVKVYVNGVELVQSGNWTMTSASGSFATLARPITNATITFATAKTGTIDIVGARRPRRTSQFQESQPVTARAMNQVLTDLWMTERERWDYIPRTVFAQPGETIGPLPAAASRASGVFGFDPSGNPTILAPSLGLGTIVGPNVSVDGHVLCFSGTTGQLAKDCGPSVGSVLSVALSMPAIFSVSGSPVTSIGTLAAALATQAANTVWAGPTTGAAATPAFRALVNADLPTVDVSHGGTGATTLTNHGILLGQGTSLLAATAVMTDGQLLVGQSAADPLPKTLSGDATLGSTGALTIASHAVTNGKSAQMAAATIKMNATAGTADATDLDINSLSDIGSPSTTLDWIPIKNHTTGAIEKTNASQLLTALGPGVTSISPGGGITSDVTQPAPGSAITTTGTLSAAQVVNAQTGTSYAILDADRGKLITATNANAQAYTIAQAATASAFLSGWYVDIQNNSTTVAGLVTVTPATSTISGATSLVIAQGHSVRIVSDGTNYQVLGANPARPIGFYLHKNSTNQTGMLNGAYDRVTWSTAKYNVGGGTFSGNRWTAPVTGLLHMNATAWWTANAASSANPTFLLKIIKNSPGTCNGTDVFAGNGSAVVGFPGTANAQANGDDQATAGDIYEVCAFGNSSTPANDLQIDGNQAHVHWSGTMVR